MGRSEIENAIGWVLLFMVVLFFFNTLMLSSIRNRVDTVEKLIRQTATTTSTVRDVGLTCVLPDGHKIRTGPGEAARLHLRCR